VSPTRTIKNVIKSVIGQGMAQGVNAITALLRIPILVLALSTGGYGILTLVQSAVPWLLVLPTGLRYSMRVMGADAKHSENLSAGQILDLHLSESRRLVRILYACGVPLAALVALAQPGLASPDKNDIEAFATLALLILLCGSSFSGAVYTGWLEVHSRNGLVNALGAATGIGGLVLTYALWRAHAPFIAFAVAGVASFVTPSWCGWLLARGRGHREPAPSGLKEVVSRNNRRFVLATLASLFSAGLAPFVINLILGPEYVAAHAIAARLSVMITIVPMALTPVLWNFQARLKSQAALGRTNTSAATSRILVVSGVAGALISAAFCLVGPYLGHRLGAQRVAAPLALYLAFSAHGFFQFLIVPLSSSLTGPRGVAYMARTTAIVAGASAALSFPVTMWIGVSGPVWSGVVGFAVLCAIWLRKIQNEGGMMDDVHVPNQGVTP
jgi:O-antigen/teichoic acid export membrane protein